MSVSDSANKLRKQRILTHSDTVTFKVWIVYIASGGFEVDELLPSNISKHVEFSVKILTS